MLPSIKKFVERYKEELFLVLAIMLIALTSFGLGRLSVSSTSFSTLKLESTPVSQEDLVKALKNKQANTDTAQEKGSVEGLNVVGNKNSKIYHLENCIGAKLMSEKNKVYFVSAAAATSAGYTPAGNCPGLK